MLGTRQFGGRTTPSTFHSVPASVSRSSIRQACCSRRRLRAVSVAAIDARAPLVKICGINSADDAALAAGAGADFIGMILWPKAKRSVSVDTAAAIAAAALERGARPVAVFVDEDAETIARICAETGIGIAQLHGDGARRSLQALPASLEVIYVLHSTPEGAIQTPLPADGAASPTAVGRSVDWLLVDGLKGGSGEALDWEALSVPSHLGRGGWILAGGLHPGNVAEAARTASPGVVDVSSGVAGMDGVAKDAEKVLAFIAAAKGVRVECEARV